MSYGFYEERYGAGATKCGVVIVLPIVLSAGNVHGDNMNRDVRNSLDIFELKKLSIALEFLAQMGDWSAAIISDYSHRDMPWLATRDGEEINYELVFYREPPYSVRYYGNDTDRV